MLYCDSLDSCIIIFYKFWFMKAKRGEANVDATYVTYLLQHISLIIS
jgi:hypothetical protein